MRAEKLAAMEDLPEEELKDHHAVEFVEDGDLASPVSAPNEIDADADAQRILDKLDEDRANEVKLVKEFLGKFVIASESAFNDKIDITLLLKAIPN